MEGATFTPETGAEATLGEKQAAAQQELSLFIQYLENKYKLRLSPVIVRAQVMLVWNEQEQQQGQDNGSRSSEHGNEG